MKLLELSTILGAVWVFGVRPDFTNEYNPITVAEGSTTTIGASAIGELNMNYCHPVVYWFAFATLILYFLTIAFAMACMCCMLCCALCCAALLGAAAEEEGGGGKKGTAKSEEGRELQEIKIHSAADDD